jgi:hypothetical protein
MPAIEIAQQREDFQLQRKKTRKLEKLEFLTKLYCIMGDHIHVRTSDEMSN